MLRSAYAIRNLPWFLLAAICFFDSASAFAAKPTTPPSATEIIAGLKRFYSSVAQPDGNYLAAPDPEYLGLAGAAYTDMSALSHVVMIHKALGITLENEAKTRELVLNRQLPDGSFVHERGTARPGAPNTRLMNTTQGVVILHALGAKPKYDPLPVFEEIMREQYKTLPAYATSFFPLAYAASGERLPADADRKLRAIMVSKEDGFLHDHIAATFHAAHYYRLLGAATPQAEKLLDRAVRDQKSDGSYLLNLPSRDRHATYDAAFTLYQLGHHREDCRKALQKAADWSLRCRNLDGGFGHYPGSPSDVDAIYFTVGTLVIAGRLPPAKPLPKDPHLLSWGLLFPLPD